tara:strand:+ start:96 stop:557 length:462 start_codon:yes stop_codon:yes gene_type:complete
MNLRELIDKKYKSSIKSRNTDEINTFRLIRSAIKYKDLENRASSDSNEINDEQILNVLQSLVKQRKDSIVSFKEVSRDDLVAKESKEIEIISQFLPKQLSAEEIKNIIGKFISDNNIESVKEMGKIMGFLKMKNVGSIDMSLASKIAKELLGS